MKLKLAALAALAAAFFGLFVFGPFFNHLGAQCGVFILVLVWSAARSSPRSTLGALKTTLPFVVSLLLFGAIFQLLRLQGRADWWRDSLIKALLFPSTLIFLQVLLSYISYLDLLSLPLSMSRRFDLITVKSIFQKGGRYLGRFSWYLDTYPYLRSQNALRQGLRKYAALIVALYLYLYEETENANLLLRNRYAHLRRDTDG